MSRINQNIQNEYNIWASGKDCITDEERNEKLNELYSKYNLSHKPVVTEPMNLCDLKSKKPDK